MSSLYEFATLLVFALMWVLKTIIDMIAVVLGGIITIFNTSSDYGDISTNIATSDARRIAKYYSNHPTKRSRSLARHDMFFIRDIMNIIMMYGNCLIAFNDSHWLYGIAGTAEYCSYYRIVTACNCILPVEEINVNFTVRSYQVDCDYSELYNYGIPDMCRFNISNPASKYDGIWTRSYIYVCRHGWCYFQVNSKIECEPQGYECDDAEENDIRIVTRSCVTGWLPDVLRQNPNIITRVFPNKMESIKKLHPRVMDFARVFARIQKKELNRCVYTTVIEESKTLTSVENMFR